ncbi:unnamed protein product, partial [Mesorhabditis spiculigera]
MAVNMDNRSTTWPSVVDKFDSSTTTTATTTTTEVPDYYDYYDYDWPTGIVDHYYEVESVDGVIYPYVLRVDWAADQAHRWPYAFNPMICWKEKGDIQFRETNFYYWTYYRWDGTPFHQADNWSHPTDEPKITASMFVLSLLGMALATTSGYLVRKNRKLTRIVVSSANGEGRCYTGYHFTPVFYGRTTRFHKSYFHQTLVDLMPIMMLMLQAFTLVIDSIALVTIRRKLAATNALIFGKQLVSMGTEWMYPEPRASYLAYSVYEFIHCALISCIVITFNMSYYEPKSKSPHRGTGDSP